MPILLSVQDVYKSFGSQDILRGASMQIQDGQKIAILGRNGSGKSTLFHMLLGDTDIDGGDIIKHRDLRIGYLRQHDDFQGMESALEYLMRETSQPDWKCSATAARFDISNDVLAQPMAELSGGWQTRVKLSALILHDPNLLMLDEPTNFLDLRTQMLLEEFLKTSRAALLLISHDRRFLKATCNFTCELRNHQLTLEPGDVDTYLARQQERREHAERSNKNLQVKRDQLQRFVDKNRASAGTASQARNKAKQVERLDEQIVDVDDGFDRIMAMRIPDIEERKGTALSVQGLDIGYPDKTVARAIDLHLEYARRVAVLGDNGQGKTTLLRTLCDSLDPIAGKLKWGYHCRLGVYAQHVYQALSGTVTVLQYLESQARDELKTQDLLDTAGSFLFNREAVEKPVSVLSGGERARLCLAGLIVSDCTVLVLDEPSNHLDIESVAVLSDALCRYRGTILFTSHDSDFVKAIATDIVEVKGGSCLHVPGNYSDYVYRLAQEAAAASEASQANDSSLTKSTKPEQKKEKSAALDYKTEKKLRSLERRLEKRQAEEEQLKDQIASCVDNDELLKLSEELVTLQRKIEEIEEEWLLLQE